MRKTKNRVIDETDELSCKLAEIDRKILAAKHEIDVATATVVQFCRTVAKLETERENILKEKK